MIFGFDPVAVVLIVVVAYAISSFATALAMESTALFVPAFMLLLPALVVNFPSMDVNEAIGLTLVIMFFGQTSTVTGYWYRGQIEARLAGKVLALTIPFAVAGRTVSYMIPSAWLLAAFAALLFVLATVIFQVHGRGSDHSADGGMPDPSAIRFDLVDRIVLGAAGLFAGLIGFAIGELSNAVVSVRNDVSVKTSIGTCTLVLYLTILSATLTNLVLLAVGFAGANEVAIPWRVAGIVAPVVVVGGQTGAFLNNRLPERAIVRTLIGAYAFVGLVTVGRLIA